MAHLNNEPDARLANVPTFNDEEISAALAPCHLDRWWSVDVNQLDLSVLMDDRLLEREMAATASVQQSPTWSSSGYSSCGDGDQWPLHKFDEMLGSRSYMEERSGATVSDSAAGHQTSHRQTHKKPANRSQMPQIQHSPKLLPVELYCVCNEPAGEGHMIACDSPFGCPIEWFHFGCVNMKAPPKGDWMCPLCKSLL